jgi:hypothetical protein
MLLVVNLLVGCVETFEVSYDLDRKGVVITGIITDLKPANVEITRTASSPITRKENLERITDAIVVLNDSDGGREELVETSIGTYEGQNLGVAGRSYHVEILLPDGTEIVSKPQKLKESPPIDSLYIENVADYQTVGNSQVDTRGLNLNLYMNSSDTVANYYKWTVGGTYVLYTAYNTPGRQCNSIVSGFDIQPCYVTRPDDGHFVLGESDKQGVDEFAVKLKYLRPSSQFAFGHSVLVTQYSQTAEAFEYWKKIDDQARSVGSIFDPPPSQITGNLSISGNPTVEVLGFFEASSVKSRRIFIERRDFETLEENSPVFSDAGINAPCFDIWSGEFGPYDYCCDCANHENSTRIEPSYWQ